MRRWTVVVLVVALALTLVPLAVAGGGGWAHGKSKFNLVGRITAVDTTAGTLTVHVKAGTKTTRALRGGEATLMLDPAARVRLVTRHGCVKATLDQLPLDVKVKVRGRIDRTDPAAPVFVATFVKAKGEPVVPAPELTPEPTPTDPAR